LYTVSQENTPTLKRYTDFEALISNRYCFQDYKNFFIPYKKIDMQNGINEGYHIQYSKYHYHELKFKNQPMGWDGIVDPTAPKWEHIQAVYFPNNYTSKRVHINNTNLQQ